MAPTARRFTRLPMVLAMVWVVIPCFVAGAVAQVSPDLYSGLQWRNIGPNRGGRIASVTGVVGDGATFYVGLPLGGIWKTTSAGTTWFPIFDQVTQVDSIGAIQVAPSDANIIYAGSGDSIQGSNGDGMYKSTDAGRTWARSGLEDTTKINKIVVDPKDPNLVLASTTGDEQHHGGGVYRSTDGGQTWSNVLKPEGVNGTRDLEYAYDLPNVIFAATQGGGGGFGGPGAAGGAGRANNPALYKSLDEGKTWTVVGSLPPFTGRIGVAVAMHTNGQRVYVVGGVIQPGGSGLFRSDDQGKTWKQMALGDSRVSNGQGTYSCGVWVDSQNPDILYTVSTAAYRSTDGGVSFIAFKGAPGGEDFHDIWVDPTNGKRMLFGTDQGPAVTLNGGLTWSSYYAMPVAQVYHISTDNQYPYWVLASQQDTGATRTRARGNLGDISELDWSPMASSEFGTITPDPLDPNIAYAMGSSNAGGGTTLLKMNLYTGQWGNVAPNFGADADKYRSSRDSWRRFDPFDPHAMYADYQCLLVTRDGGHSWKAFSPDLTVARGEPSVPCGQPPAPAAGGGGRGGGGGGASINDFSISTAQRGVFWTVSSNGQIYNTIDNGLHWNNVSNIVEPGVAFNTIEAGHGDIQTAYIAGRIGGGRGDAEGAGDANAALIWRTHNGGKTWTKIVNGFPADQPTGSWVNAIREDPKQKGLLFAGTETTVYVSFDDGDHWQSLRQNLPTTSIRDMVFHNDDHMNDLVIGTYGRGIWVLDDMSPLREIAAKAGAIAATPAYLFKPGDAIRSRVASNRGQPMNPELPHEANPPYGVIFYYHLSRPPAGAIQLQVFDAAGRLVRTISSIAPTLPEQWPYPSYWVATPADLALPTAVGTNRFNWDLRYDDPPAFTLDLETQQEVEPGGFVTPAPHGPQVIPGVYKLVLTVDGQTYAQSATVRNDPRVGEGAKVMADLREQNRLVMLAFQGAKDSYAGNGEVEAVRAQVASLTHGNLPADLAAAATAFDGKLAAFGGVTAGRGGRGGGGGGGRGRGGTAGRAGVESFIALNNNFDAVVSLEQVGLDEAPAPSMIDTWKDDCEKYNATVAAWKALQADDVTAFNAALTNDNLPALRITASALPTASCLFVPPAAASGQR